MGTSLNIRKVRLQGNKLHTYRAQQAKVAFGCCARPAIPLHRRSGHLSPKPGPQAPPPSPSVRSAAHAPAHANLHAGSARSSCLGSHVTNDRMSALLEFSAQAGHGAGAGGCVFVVHPEGVRLVTCGADAQLAERDECTGAVIGERRLADLGNVSPVLGIAAAPGGGRVATVDKAGNAKVQPGSADRSDISIPAQGHPWSTCPFLFSCRRHLWCCNFCRNLSSGSGQALASK